MLIKGKIFAESPLYRGNARKTLFTRDGDGTHRLVSLAGEISGTAQALMDAFIGQSRDGRNMGLLNRLWLRLYNGPMPRNLITSVKCQLNKESYPRGNFFDLRMGLRLDEDRWAAEANANYKMETLLRKSVFDFEMSVNDKVLQQNENKARLYYLLQELAEGRFWFGAGKSKGLGRLRLEAKLPFAAPATPPTPNRRANHLTIHLTFDTLNPLLVGWNWGKVDPETPSFAAVEGHLLVGAMRNLPPPIRERLEMSLGGPILNPDDWKKKLAAYLPRVIAIWLQEESQEEIEVWTLPASALTKLGKGKYGLSKKVIARLEPLVGRPFFSHKEAEEAIVEALADKAKMAKRVLKEMQKSLDTVQSLNEEVWAEIADSLGLDPALSDELSTRLEDETALIAVLSTACQAALPHLYQQVDQQIHLLQSDSWVDAEMANREEHLRIKVKLREGKISEAQWGHPDQPPEGISAAAWREFLNDHRRVRFHHLLNTRNLDKSIVNDRNFIAFLKHYRNRARQELSQPHHIDFRIGGPSKRAVARKYGKPYDTVFMRMLSWTLSNQPEEGWEVYIPGSTIKGAFRKRATQILRTLWGETAKTDDLLNRLFGAQRQRGLVFFSDAYLLDPNVPDRHWCSMDGVRMDSKTGAPIETAKHDYLYAYGKQLSFHFQIDVQDVTEDDWDALNLLFHLLQDFQHGDIPIGGEKSSGFGWVEGKVANLTWLAGTADGIGKTLFPGATPVRNGLWYTLNLEGEEVAATLKPAGLLEAGESVAIQSPPKAASGFTSHRAFGGHCGMLVVEAEPLTPLAIRESGQPSRTVSFDDGPVNGWDFFSMAPPDAALRDSNRQYAIPSKSLRGLLRHIYTIASDSKEESADINHLNPVDSLFGWVGRGPNQALMGRLSIGFGFFDNPSLAWFKIPFPYGEWHYSNRQWRSSPGTSADKLFIAKQWRIFPHTPLAPIVQQLDDFSPDTSQASYFRAVLPGSKARFTIRFWNLDDLELKRLLWSVVLEPSLAHKMGHARYLGFGSLRLRLLPASYLIDWSARYADQPETAWQRPIQVEDWLTPQVIYHYKALKNALNADSL